MVDLAAFPVSGAVVSEQQRASEVGTRILARGGNAADAIVATCIAVGTTSMYHSDLGGGGFAIIRTAKGEYESLNFRHAAPKAATAEFYLTASTTVGGAAVAVPGQLRGLEELHRRHGRLPWADLFTDSIELAEGMVMGRDLRDYVKRELADGSTKRTGSFLADDPMYDIFFDAKGELLDPEAIVRRPEYVKALKAIAEGGADAFYTGKIAEGVVKTVQARGGLMTLEDMKHYRAEWNAPISVAYKDHTFWTIPAPASGAIWLSVTGILSHFESEGSGSIADLHRLTEVLRLAYGTRTQLGDPNFVPGLESAQKQWISPEFTQKRAALIDDTKTFPPEYYKPPGVEIKADAGTSNITTADSDGMVISITTTVGLNFGSRIIVPGSGIVLNSSMDDFSVQGRPNFFGYEPSPANFIAGGKRPLSSSCPYIIAGADGRVVLAGGSAGGSLIISANAQVARNVLDYGMSAAEALRASRLHNQVIPNVTLLETTGEFGDKIEGFTEAQAKGLETKGHRIEWVKPGRTTSCAIRFSHSADGTHWEPAGDPRRYDSGGSVWSP